MAGMFASRSLYQVVVVFELLFSIVIFSFALKALIIYQDQLDSEFTNETPYLLYSICVAIGLSVIQICFALLLIILTRGSNSFDKKDLAIGTMPSIWLIQAMLSFPTLFFVFVTPVAKGYDFMEARNDEFQSSLKEMFSYVIVDALFKPFFIWMVCSTLRCSCGRKIEEDQEALQT